MKLLESDGNKFVFHLDRDERAVLTELLSRYPLIPETHQRLTRSGDSVSEDNQEMLREALAEQRKENKRQLDTMLAEPDRFKRVKSGFHLTLSGEQIEWLLQVVNDIRVGSWILLGEPDETHGGEMVLSEQNLQYFWSMELAGQFEAFLLRAVDGQA